MNKKYIFAITVAIISILAVALYSQVPKCSAGDSCNSVNQSENKKSKAEIVQSELSEGTATLIDVREPYEFDAGHVDNARNVALGIIESQNFDEENKDKTIYLYCQSGRRAGIAKTALEKQGYTNVINLGGVSNWE